jgi:acetyl-CoA carboxylase biotin carboxyl carrier protein
MRKESLTYEDVLRIVELVKTTRFSEFRLKVGEVEVHLKRTNGSAGDPAAHSETVPQTEKPAPARNADRSFPAGAVLVRAPMVGTFYRAPAPGADPFVEVGRHVDADTTVCIIEVMKLMNSIPAEARGVVTEILVANGAHVEPGDVLVVIKPDPEDG